MSQSAPRPDADAISPELRLAADDLAVAFLRLLRAIDRESEPGPAQTVDTGALPAGTQEQEREREREQGRLAYTVPEAARLLGVSASLVHEQIRAGHIPTFTVGTRVLVSRVDLERLAGGADAESRRVVELMTDRRRKRR